MTDCIFCKIAAKELPSDVLYEDEDTVAFLDIQPNNPGHTLVIPKAHTRNIFDTEDASLAAVMRTVRKLAPAIRDAVGAGGVNINSNHEPSAGQVVFHLHIHIIPRFADDGYTFWPKKAYAPGQKEEVAAKIRSALA